MSKLGSTEKSFLDGIHVNPVLINQVTVVEATECEGNSPSGLVYSMFSPLNGEVPFLASHVG